MSQENVEIVRGMHEVVGTEAALDCFDPEVVMFPTPSGPDAAAPYVGYDGLNAWVRDFREALGDFQTYAQEIIDVGDSRVLAITVVHGEGRASGIPFDFRSATVYTLRDGRIVRVEAYDTKVEALEAVGLRE
jgi:ketosteroid isomerase-like protein